MNRIESQSPKGLLFSKLYTYDEYWYREKELQFLFYKYSSSDCFGAYDEKSDKIIYKIFDYCSASGIPEHELKIVAANKDSYLWIERKQDFFDFCWYGDLNNRFYMGFREIIPLAEDYIRSLRTTDFFWLTISTTIEGIINELLSTHFPGAFINSNTDEGNSHFPTDYNKLISVLLNRLKRVLLKKFIPLEEEIKKSLGVCSNAPITGLSKLQCQKICELEIFGNAKKKMSLVNCYFQKDSEVDAVIFFQNMISNRPKNIEGLFSIFGHGAKGILYNMLYTIEKDAKIIIDRGTIEQKKWIEFENIRGSSNFIASSSMKHLNILPQISSIINSI